jgi:hypothetical protein
VRDLGERSSAASHRRDEDDEVVNGAAEDDAEQDPDVSGQESELGREDGADEGAGSGDGGEVMSEEDPLLVGVEVRPSFRVCDGVTQASSRHRILRR